MISLKPGVKLEHLSPQILLGIVIVAGIYARWGADLTITVGSNGTHKVGSLHGKGDAVDLRTHNITADVRDGIYEQAKKALGENYDILLEGKDTENEHLHVEYDPHGNK